MRDPQTAWTATPWWWPQTALFWAGLTGVYAGLTWLGRRAGLWVLAVLLCVVLFAAAAGIASVFIRGAERTPNRFSGRTRMIWFTVALLLATAAVGCLAGYGLA